jgi:hypothetical protein
VLVSLSAADVAAKANPLPKWGSVRTLLWACTACAVALALRSPSMMYPWLAADDFQILLQSYTWHDTVANLWVPANEHSMPLGRLTTYALVRLAGSPTRLPLTLALQGPLALLACMVLLYVFVRREVGHPFPALLAMTLFGACTHYQDAVYWFAASFALLGLATVLLGLLAAQRRWQTGSRVQLGFSALWCGLAPGWFGSGLLAGPLCALYLLWPERAAADAKPGTPRPPFWRRSLPALVPLLGTVFSLAITMPLNAERILNLPRVEEDKKDLKARETLDPVAGLEYTLRATVDSLVPGVLGVDTLYYDRERCPGAPRLAVPAWLALLGAVALWWWLRAPHRRLLLLGLGFIFFSYVIIFTVRAYLPYEEVHHWGRYHLFAHLGLVVFFCGGWPLRRFLAHPEVGGVHIGTGGRFDLLAAGALLLFTLAQVPFTGGGRDDLSQRKDLRRVERVDALCREHHIDAETARAALSYFCPAGCGERDVNGQPISGWDLLRGSPDPRPVSVEEARSLLLPAAQE